MLTNARHEEEGKNCQVQCKVFNFPLELQVQIAFANLLFTLLMGISLYLLLCTKLCFVKSSMGKS